MRHHSNNLARITDSDSLAARVASQVDAMLGYWDRDERCRFANAAYCSWLGRSPEELLGQPKQELLGPLYEANRRHILGALCGIPQKFERCMTGPDGAMRHYVISYYPDISSGSVNGFTVHAVDVTRMKLVEFELQAARAEAEQLATHDFLTGLPNRVHLNDRILEALAQAKSTGGLSGVVAIDFDNFKMVNDRFGHDLGDVFLQEISRRMASAVRASDSVTRLGGDEFIYLATGMNASSNLDSVINRLRLIICQPIHIRGATMMPCFCCGVAVYPWHGHSSAELLIRADRALYQAKAIGPGSFVIAQMD